MKLKVTPNLLVVYTILPLILFYLTSCNRVMKNKLNEEISTFVDTHELKIADLTKELNNAMFNSYITGNDKDFEKVTGMQIKINELFANKKDFKKLEKYKNKLNLIDDDLLKRQVNVLYNIYIPYQADKKLSEEIIKLENKLQQKIGTHRTNYNNKTLTEIEVDEILVNSTNSNELKGVWLASKKIGNKVSKDLIRLVKLRNKMAKELGYTNYYEMKLILSEQDPKEVKRVFDELDILTKEPYAQLKKQMDKKLSKHYKIKVEELKPWHYQDRFLQNAPNIYGINFDNIFKNNILNHTKEYFNSIGLSIKDIIKRSDLYENSGKTPHSFTFNIDRLGTVKVIGNLKNNFSKMRDCMYEFGVATYLKYTDKHLPFSLRQPVNFITVEGIATLFSRNVSEKKWLDQIYKPKNKKSKIDIIMLAKYNRLQQMIFARWSQVMYNFERMLYENPDQNLNKLWNELVKRYQLLDNQNDKIAKWATKIHIVTTPCYYHNYMLAELFASQILYTLSEKIIHKEVKEMPMFNNVDIGNFLIMEVFVQGAKYKWDELIERITGKKLSPEFFTMQYLQ